VRIPKKKRENKAKMGQNLAKNVETRCTWGGINFPIPFIFTPVVYKQGGGQKSEEK